RYIRLGTCGGASAMDGPAYGHADHFMWVTMTPEGPRIANILIDGVYDENMMTETTARFVDHLTREGGVQATAVVVEGGAFTAGTATVSLSNAADVPMRVTGALDAAPGVTAAPASFDLAVPERGAATVELRLAAAEPRTAGGPAATLTWTARADLPDRPGFSVTRALPLWIELGQTCPTAARPVTPDGVLDEWADLPHAVGREGLAYPESWTGAADASVRFAVACDQRYLYVAVRAADDQRVLRADKAYWEQDAIELWLDVRPRAERLASHAPADGRLALGVCPGGTAEHDSGARAVSTVTDDGYAVEFAIPLTCLTDRQGDAWDGFRLNVVQFDADADGTSQLRWRPSWRSGDTFIGSGAFARQ
ncbi:MAG: hypothetical protein GX591_13550, partial [Planctomycetes bacterium]|nr:hypothetical protein [Planctomycetota bacterium]